MTRKQRGWLAIVLGALIYVFTMPAFLSPDEYWLGVLATWAIVAAAGGLLLVVAFVMRWIDRGKP